jgi:hypothetical protein
MITKFGEVLNRTINLRRGSSAHVPIFDNALKGNDILQGADLVARFNDANDLATDGKRLFVADGSSVYEVSETGEKSLRVDADQSITALACIGGGHACALRGTEVRVFGGRFDGWSTKGSPESAFKSVNALDSNGSQLIATDGSESRNYDQWRHDLMEHGKSGRVFALDAELRRTTLLKSGMSFAFGAAQINNRIFTSESWGHQLLALDRSGKSEIVLTDLPAYPSRIAKASDGLWITMFCARSQLVEFVLRETAYRQKMIESIEPDFWISPQLKSFADFQEPLQWGALRQSGTVKPWAPPRSYGLVAKLDASGSLQYSFHSRMGGRFHGIVAAAELDGYLYLLSRGENLLVRINVAQAERNLIP